MTNTNNLHNALFLKALRHEPIPRTPIWIMRQAGRYLPEYRKLRAQAKDFMSVCRNKEWACELALQPLRRFKLDAGILFSDILTIPDAMGLGLYFVEGEGPCFRHPLQTQQSIETLKIPKVEEDLAYVMDALRLIRREMPADLPLIGFAGSPWTLACYMVEGKSQHDFLAMRTLLDKNPDLATILLEKLSLTLCDYLSAQVQAGANALMIFDTWGGLLSTEVYYQFSLKPMQDIVQFLKKEHPDIPVIVFTKGAKTAWLTNMIETGCDALGLDWTIDLKQARQLVQNKIALQGNLQPSILLEDEKTIRTKVHALLSSYGHGSGHIFNLGHGITPDIPVEHVKIMIDAVHEFSPAFHA